MNAQLYSHQKAGLTLLYKLFYNAYFNKWIDLQLKKNKNKILNKKVFRTDPSQNYFTNFGKNRQISNDLKSDLQISYSLSFFSRTVQLCFKTSHIKFPSNRFFMLKQNSVCSLTSCTSHLVSKAALHVSHTR